MKIIIDDKVCKKHKMTLPETLIALAVRQMEGGEIEEMISKGILYRSKNDAPLDTFIVPNLWKNRVDKILASSSGNINDEERLANLAEKVRECFPKQKMRDRYGRETPYFYKCNKTEVKNRLGKFFEKFGNFSDEDVIDATQRYVASFKGNYTNMRLAKYFIMKDDKKLGEDGEAHVEVVSDLLSFLENKDTEDSSSNDEFLNTMV